MTLLLILVTIFLCSKLKNIFDLLEYAGCSDKNKFINDYFDKKINKLEEQREAALTAIKEIGSGKFFVIGALFTAIFWILWITAIALAI